jgi:hypothetical protein
MSSYASTYNRQAAPEVWRTVRYAVRAPGGNEWCHCDTRVDAEIEREWASRACKTALRVFAEQEYCGDLPELRGKTRVIGVGY